MDFGPHTSQGIDGNNRRKDGARAGVGNRPSSGAAPESPNWSQSTAEVRR
jgi:hypothetical protein